MTTPYRRPNRAWIRTNGQAHLRENVRRAIRETPLTQARVAQAAGMKPNRLTGFLGGSTWWTRADTDAIVSVLNAAGHQVTTESLTGPSIYDDDDWPKRRAFDFKPVRDSRGRVVPTEPAPPEPIGVVTRGICCTCASLRPITIAGETDIPTVGEHGDARWVFDVYCGTCSTQTRHAVLRTGEHRNYAEDRDHRPTADEAAQVTLRAHIERLTREFGVDVRFRSRPKKNREKGYAAYYSWDDSKSQWRIEIDPGLPPVIQVSMLESIWADIAADNFAELDWDVRQTGVVAAPSSAEWGQVADDLVEDIRRYIDVERRKLVQDLNDEYGATVQQADATADERSRA